MSKLLVAFAFIACLAWWPAHLHHHLRPCIDPQPGAGSIPLGVVRCPGT